MSELTPIDRHAYDVAEINLEQAAKALEKRWFKVSIVPSLAEAAHLVLHSLLPESGAQSVAFGGSTTIEQSGLVQSLQEVPGLKVMNTYDKSNGVEALIQLRREALLCDLFLCSANAMTVDGKILLLDLFGNRTAAVQFGPKKVILIIGKNKICTDTHAAMARVRNVAAPLNARRLNRKTPCYKTGRCMSCSSADNICANWTILERSGFKERIHIVLVNEEVGF